MSWRLAGVVGGAPAVGRRPGTGSEACSPEHQQTKNSEQKSTPELHKIYFWKQPRLRSVLCYVDFWKLYHSHKAQRTPGVTHDEPSNPRPQRPAPAAASGRDTWTRPGRPKGRHWGLGLCAPLARTGAVQPWRKGRGRVAMGAPAPPGPGSLGEGTSPHTAFSGLSSHPGLGR